MALDTYSNLKTTIADYVDRDDLAAQIDDFIDLAEARHKREIRIREMQVRAQASASTRFLSLPSGFLEMQTLRLLTDPVTVLTEINFEEMNRARIETTTGGRPRFFTIHEEIEFDKIPDQAYTAEMIYYQAFTPLSDANTTNGLLTRAPDLYLYGALLAAAPFLVEDDRIQVWNGLYEQASDGLKLADRRGRHSGAIASRVFGATP